MRRRSKKERERLVCHELLRFMRYRIIQLTSFEKPDLLATVEKDGCQKRLGIELTYYYVDASPASKGGSPTFGLVHFWQQVQTSIRRRIARRRKLWHMTGNVFFKSKMVPTGSVARAMARQLVGLALEHAVAPDQYKCVTNFSSGASLLQEYVTKVILHGTGCAVRLSWTNGTTSAAMVGVIRPLIIEIIQTKAEKAKDYDWQPGYERWLAICATGYPITSSAGPLPDSLEYSMSGMADIAKHSGFNRVLIWDRPNRWCKSLWPNEPLIGVRISNSAG